MQSTEVLFSTIAHKPRVISVPEAATFEQIFPHCTIITAEDGPYWAGEIMNRRSRKRPFLVGVYINCNYQYVATGICLLKFKGTEEVKANIMRCRKIHEHDIRDWAAFLMMSGQTMLNLFGEDGLFCQNES